MSRKYIEKGIPEKVKIEIGKRLKSYAQSNHNGVTGLAEAIGIPQSQISTYTTGKTVPSGQVLYLLAQAGLSIDELFLGDEKKSDDSFTKILNKFSISDPKKLEEILKLYTELKTKLIKTI